MSIMKRATTWAQELDPNLIIVKGLWGYSAQDRRYRRQECTLVRHTVERVMEDLRSGQRPKELPERERGAVV